MELGAKSSGCSLTEWSNTWIQVHMWSSRARTSNSMHGVGSVSCLVRTAAMSRCASASISSRRSILFVIRPTLWLRERRVL
jgi:hypothetical protein